MPKLKIYVRNHLLEDHSLWQYVPALSAWSIAMIAALSIPGVNVVAGALLFLKMGLSVRNVYISRGQGVFYYEGFFE